MLDIAYIRENTKKVEDSIRRRGLKVDVGELLKRYELRNKHLREREDLKKKLNNIDKRSDGKRPGEKEIEEAKRIKSELEKARENFRKADDAYLPMLHQVPNLIAEGTPDGGEENNKVEKETAKPKLEFEPKDHQSLAEANGWLDFERGAKVAGNKFYYVKGAAVNLELALMRYGLDKLAKHDFVPMLTPHMVSKKIAEGTGFAPRGEEEEHQYKIQGEDLFLIATAEVSLTGYHTDEILDLDKLPALYGGITPSYRKEAGAYGKHSKGLFRVHQFDKLEMYALCAPEDSESWHQKILKIEEEICKDLEIPHRVVLNATGDLGAPAYKKYDIEYWSPVDKAYRELTSCSNCTDYQARNLNIRYRNKDGKTEFVHTLNGTAVVFSRFFIAILENHQQADGSVALPKALHKYYGKGGL